jgi:hypothetical protein
MNDADAKNHPCKFFKKRFCEILIGKHGDRWRVCDYSPDRVLACELYRPRDL